MYRPARSTAGEAATVMFVLSCCVSAESTAAPVVEEHPPARAADAATAKAIHGDALNLWIGNFLSPPGLRACPRGTRHLRSVLLATPHYERFATILAMRKYKTEFVTKSQFYGISDSRAGPA